MDAAVLEALGECELGDEIEIRSVEELVKQWPETWSKFEATAFGEGKTDAEKLEVTQDMLRFVLELSKSEVEEEEFEQVMPIAMQIIRDERILPTHGEIIAIVAFSIELFTNLYDAYPTACAPNVETVVKKVQALILSFAQIPTFGKKQVKPESTTKVVPVKPGRAAFVDSDEEDEDDDDDDEGASDEDSRLFVWNQCVQVILKLLEDDDQRPRIAEVANSLIGPAVQFIKDADFVQLKVEAGELLEQVCLLSFTPAQYKTWLARQYEESPLEEFLNEEEESDPSEMIGQVEKNEAEYDAFPFCKCDLSAEKAQDLLLYLVDFNAEAAEAEVNFNSLIGVITAVISRMEPEVSGKTMSVVFDLMKKKINQAGDALEKIPLFVALKELFVYAPAASVQAVFVDMYAFMEGVMALELRKLKPVGGNKKHQGGGGRGRGGRGRGRGGGGGPAKPDPEKEMQFKVLQKQMASTLASLLAQGGMLLFGISDKFFNTTSTSFKSHELHFTFLCSFGTELYKLTSTGTQGSRPDFEAQSKLLANKLEVSYKAMGDNLGSKFVAAKSKLEGCKCLSQVSSATFEGAPIFPQYLLRTITGLLDVATKDAYKVGPPVFVCLEKVIMANKKSEVLQNKIPEIIQSVVKYLTVPEGKDDDEMYNNLQLVGCEILALIFYQPELRPQAQASITALAPLLKTIIQVSGDTIKNFEELGQEESDEDGNDANGEARVTDVTDECPALIAVEEGKTPSTTTEEAKKEEKKEESKSEPEATLTKDISNLSIKEEKPAEEKPASTTPAPITFNFTPSVQPATTPSTGITFNFGGATTANAGAQSFPKFEFGGSSSTPFVAPTFNFGSTGTTATTTTGTSLGGTSLGGTSLGGTSLGGATTLGGGTSLGFGAAPVTTPSFSLGGTIGQPQRASQPAQQNQQGGRARGGGNAGRGGGGGRGRGRGRVVEVESDDDSDEDDDDDEDDEDDDDDDELDDSDDDDDDDEEDDDEDPLEHEITLCLYAFSIVSDMLKCENATENAAFQELVTQSLDTATYLDNTPYASHVRDILQVLRPETGADDAEKPEQQ